MKTKVKAKTNDKNKDKTSGPRVRYGINPGGKTIYIGNLFYSMDEGALFGLFGKFGKVKYVNLIKDPKTNKSKGIAFVDMYNEKEADTAIEVLNGREIAGRKVKVSAAAQKEEVKKPKVMRPIKSSEKSKSTKEAPVFKKKNRGSRGLQELFKNTRSKN